MKKRTLFFLPIFLTILVFVFSYIQMTFLLNLLSLPQTVDIRDERFVFVMLITASITTLLVWILYRYVHKVPLKQMGLSLSRVNIFATVMSLLLMTIGFSYYSYYSNNIAHFTTWGPVVKPIYIVQLLLIYLGVSINEEVLFRGYLHKFYKQRSILLAYLISIPLFLLPHFLTRELDGTYLLALFSATLMLTMVYDLSGSIWPGIILHFILNSYLSLLSLGVNSGSMITLRYLYYLEDSKDLLRYAEAIINTVIILFLLIFFIICKKKTQTNTLFKR